MGELQYAQLPFISRQFTLREIASGEADRASVAIMAAGLHSPDDEWVEGTALALTNTLSSDVQRAAVLTLGHLARRFARLDVVAFELAMDRLERAAGKNGLAGALSDARDDVQQFLG